MSGWARQARLVHSEGTNGERSREDKLELQRDEPPFPLVRGQPAAAVYFYEDEAGELLFAVGRYELEGKTLRQARLDRGRWVRNIDGARRTLYRLPRLLEHVAENRRDPIYVVEGEKDVEAIEAAGGVATCNPGGAGKWQPEHADALQGARRVIVIADRDDPGRRHAAQVVKSLADVGIVAELAEAADGKDAADHLAAGRTLDELGPTDQPSADPDAPGPYRIDVYTARELSQLELPIPADPLVGAFVRQGMETLLGGLTGHGKTTLIAWLIRLAVFGGEFAGQHAPGGARVLVLDLEQHLASIQRVIVEAGLADCDDVTYAPIPEGLALDKRADQLDAIEDLLAKRRPSPATLRLSSTCCGAASCRSRAWAAAS